MKYEKILKREDGSQVLIETEFQTSMYWHDQYGRYYTRVFHKGPRKRNWISATNKLGFSEDQDANLKYVTKQEIHQAKLELWEKLKPVEGI